MNLTPNSLGSQELYALSRAFAGLSVKGLKVSDPLVQDMLSNLDWKKSESLRMAQLVFKDYIAAILAIDPRGPAPEPPKVETEAIKLPTTSPRKEEQLHVPALPKEAQLSAKALKSIEQVSHWYKEAAEWAKLRSPMTPVHFLEAGILWTLGLAINRRVCLELHERIYPTLYLLLIAETSKYAKSTGMNAIRSLVSATMPHMLIPGSTTTEGMMEILSGAQPVNFDKLTKRDQELIEAGRRFAGQRGIILDEYSSLLGAMKKDYMAGFVELLMRMYDNQDSEQHHTRSGGMIIVKYPGLSILGATTPAAMARTVSAEMWENGAMARYLMMFRDEPLPYNPDYISWHIPDSIWQPLAKLHKNLPIIEVNDLLRDETEFRPLVAQISPEAHAQYHRYMQAVFYDMLSADLDERLHGNYRRMHIQAIKIALALACADWVQGSHSAPIRIELGHFALAQTIAEKARESLHRLMPILAQSSDARTQRTLLGVLSNASDGFMSVRDIVRLTGRSTKEIRSAIDVLLEAGAIEEVKHQNEGGGRPVLIYRILKAS
jgi:predicted transcriptional regulator